MKFQPLGWEDPLEKKMAPHSSILAWEIPQTEEPGGIQSMGSQRVGHNWSDLARTHTHTPSSVSRVNACRGPQLTRKDERSACFWPVSRIGTMHCPKNLDW